jgi:hypothetical protein
VLPRSNRRVVRDQKDAWTSAQSSCSSARDKLREAEIE